MINSSIAMGVKPVEIESPVNAIAKMLQMQSAQQQLKDAQQQGQLNAMKMDEYKRANERQNALRSLLGSMPNATDEQRVSALRGGAYFDEADKLDTGILNRRKTESEALSKDTESENKIIGVYRDVIGVAKDPQTAAAYVQAMHSDPRLKNTVIARVPLEQALSQIGQDPESFNSWKQKFGLGAEKFIIQNKPNQTVLNNGGANQVIQTPGLGGAPQTVMTAPITESANNIANNKRIAAEGALNRGVQERGQNMADARAKEKNQIDGNAAGKVDWKQDTEGNWIALPKEIRPGERVTPGTAAMPGKRAAQASQVLNVLDEADKLIGSGTSSYIGAGVDQAGRLIGASTKGAQAGAQLKALEGALMMAQPRMEGPQSNMDVQLYRQMAGQIGDATVPVETKKAAVKAIRALNSKYAVDEMSSKNSPTPSASGLSAQDRQAMEWAQANPSDTRSKAIMQRLGGK